MPAPVTRARPGGPGRRTRPAGGPSARPHTRAARGHRARAGLAAGVAGLLAAAVVGLLAGCGPGPAGDPASVLADAVARGLPRLTPVVLRVVPHDTGAWTEGLEIDDGVLWEGTGLAGRSELRRLDPDTGRALGATPLPDRLYGEGLTVLGPRVWQLTYRDGVVLGWDAARPVPALTDREPWSGEGWGLCHTPDGRVLASDGSDRLRVLSGADLTPLGTVPVRVAGRPLTGLNELDCGTGSVWANVYPTDWLVRIDPGSGQVTAAVDGTGLLDGPARALDPDGRTEPDVLNGVAAIPGTDQFLLTGKFWPVLLRVRFAGR